MPYPHSHTIDFQVGATSLKADVTYTVTPGQRPHYGSLTYAGDPGYPPEVDIVSVEIIHDVPENKFTGRKRIVRREPAGKLLTDIIAADEDINDELIGAALEVA